MSTSAADNTLPGYFIGPDAYGDLCVWRENGDYPQLVLTQYVLRDDPAVWDVLAAAIRTVDA